VVPGEWGGKTSIDMDWMNNFISYLIDKEIHNNFFWSLGPNSGDVGGLLLDNWTDVDQFKINLLQQLQGNPTRFNF
jgi:endoglucanase